MDIIGRQQLVIAHVGYNDAEQTVAPGECRKYLWHADREYGTCLLRSFGDLRNHKYHGLFGGIIIEPPGAKYYRTFSQVEQNHEVQSIITAPGAATFREFVLFAHNGIRMLDKAGNLIKTTEEGEPHGAHGEVDHEDTGKRASITAPNGSLTAFRGCRWLPNYLIPRCTGSLPLRCLRLTPESG